MKSILGSSHRKTRRTRKQSILPKMTPLFLRYLPKRRYMNRGGGTKYFMDCSVYKQTPEAIQTEMLLKTVDAKNVSIIRALATGDTIPKKNKQIVVKLTPMENSNSTPTHINEYSIGEFLYISDLPGFIRYICNFSCFDDTAKLLRRAKKQKPIPRPSHLHNQYVKHIPSRKIGKMSW